MTFDELKLRALAQLELRRRNKTLTDRALSFDNWLPVVSPTYCWNWRHLEYIRRQGIDGIINGSIKRLALFMPPRHGKTEMVTVRLPAWVLENDPTQRIIIGAHTQKLAEKFSRKTRRIASHRIQISKERNSASDWETVQEGGLRAIGVGGGIAGLGGNGIIIDDPVRNREEANSETYREKTYDWYTDDIFTRLEPDAWIILIMTRWHEDDLAGRLLAGDQAEKWTVINLPALAEYDDLLGRKEGQALCPERFNEAKLEIIKGQLKESFLSLYQQRPSAVEGEIFKRFWWGYYSIVPYFDRIVHSWDTAFKKGALNDYSVCTIWGVTKNGYFLIHRWKEKVEFPELKRVVVMLSQQFPPDQILIEDKASGQSLMQELERETNLPIKAIKVDIDKVARANAATPMIEAGRVHLLENAPWINDFLNNLSSFPNAPHDDDVDSVTQFILNEKDQRRQFSFTAV
jgi:predicted phage terminase large subunit-like protein